MLGSSTKKIILLLIILVLIAGAGIFGVYYMIKKAGYKISEYELQQQHLISELEADRSLKQFIETSGPDIEKLSGRIISKEGTVSFIEMLEKSARDNNLNVVVDSVTNEVSPTLAENFEALNLSFTTIGSWNNVYQFLSMLESLPYKVSIKKVDMKQSDQTAFKEGMSAGSIQWSGTFVFNVIKYK